MYEKSTQRKNKVVLFGFLALLGVVIWYIGSAWYESRKKEDQNSPALPSSDIDMTALKFLTPKEVLARLERQENLLLIDIRPEENYALEHVVDAVSLPVTTLNNFAPSSGQTIIVISGPEIPNTTLKGVHELFTERRFQFAFLQGSTVDWRFAGGNTISSGDPDSSLDYSKVIFIENTAVLPLVETLVSPLFLDVRAEALYQTSRLPGAIHIPLDTLERRRADIPKQKSIFVYGSNDFESYQAGVRLFDLGFFGVRVIRGGFELWQEKNLPLETLPQDSPVIPPPTTPSPQ